MTDVTYRTTTAHSTISEADRYDFVTLPPATPMFGHFTKNGEEFFPPVSCKICAGFILEHLTTTSQIPDSEFERLSRQIAFCELPTDHGFSKEILWLLVL